MFKSLNKFQLPSIFPVRHFVASSFLFLSMNKNFQPEASFLNCHNLQQKNHDAPVFLQLSTCFAHFMNALPRTLDIPPSHNAFRSMEKTVSLKWTKTRSFVIQLAQSFHQLNPSNFVADGKVTTPFNIEPTKT